MSKQKPINTARDAVEWVRKAMPPDQLKENGHANPRAALIWFWAYTRVAPSFSDETTRHLAMTLVSDGIPKVTYRSVNAEIGYEREDDDSFDLREELERFFGGQGEHDE